MPVVGSRSSIPSSSPTSSEMSPDSTPEMKKTYRTWFRCYQVRPQARLRLFCFPHAGGAASFFRTWCHQFPADIEIVAVQYPGREDRIREACIDQAQALAQSICQAMTPVLDQPIALFGHSMGAIVAYEVARQLAGRGTPVDRLFVSCHPAPQCQSDTAVHLQDDDGLVDEVRRLGGMSEAILANEELRDLMLAPLRNDYRLIETYRSDPLPGIDSAVVAYLGDSDPDVDTDEVRAWAEVTRGPFKSRTFVGDHFYLVPQKLQLIKDLLGHLPADA